MATTKKSTRKPKRRTAKRDKWQLHAVKAIRETGRTWMESAKGYNDKYLFRPIENGMDLMGDLRREPVKTVEEFMGKGKDLLKDTLRDPRKVFNDLADEGRSLARELADDLRAAAEDVVDGGRAVYKAVARDVSQGFEATTRKGKGLIEKAPVLNRVEEGISKGLSSVPDRLNLPNRKDMEALAKTVRTLNRKINALSKAQAG